MASASYGRGDNSAQPWAKAGSAGVEATLRYLTPCKQNAPVMNEDEEADEKPTTVWIEGPAPSS
jgi:hypothetical protein